MFEFLRLTHPPLGPQPPRAPRLSMRVPITEQTGLPLPIVAYDLPWTSVDGQRAAIVADALDELGIAIAALRCEVGDRTGGTAAGSSSPSFQGSNLFCPYRPDRYGLRIEDLTSAKVIDLRLAARRDAVGRFMHSAEQLRRWDPHSSRRSASANAAEGGAPATLWPPDVRSLDRLAGKVAQLRELSPSAAICLSVGIDSLEAGLAAGLSSGVNLMGIRADDWPIDQGPQLAARIIQARRSLDSNGGSSIRLLVVPPPTASPLDCVKLLALGADLIAIDGWCEPVLERQPLPEDEAWAIATLGVSTRPQAELPPEVDTTGLHRRIEQMVALIESAGVASVTELGPHHMATINHKLTGIRMA